MWYTVWNFVQHQFPYGILVYHYETSEFYVVYQNYVAYIISFDNAPLRGSLIFLLTLKNNVNLTIYG